MTNASKQKTCFVISPIGEEKSETRKRSDQVLRHLIEPAASDYKVTRADKIERSGMITSQIVEHVLNSELVIADLSENNPNVYYELALRHATRKPFIHIIRAGDRIPFDVSPNRTVIYDLTDPDNVLASREQIAAQVRNIERGQTEFDNPISQTQDLLTLRKSDKPDDKAIGKLLEQALGHHVTTQQALAVLLERVDSIEARVTWTPTATPGLLGLASIPIANAMGLKGGILGQLEKMDYSGNTEPQVQGKGR